MSSLLEDITKFEADNEAKVYIYDEKSGGVRSDLATGSMYKYFDDLNESAVMRVAVDLKTMTVGLYNAKTGYIERPIKEMAKSEYTSLEKYLNSLSDDVSSGTYANFTVPVPMEFVTSTNKEGNSVGILYCEISNYHYTTVDGKYVWTKTPARLSADLCIPIMRSANGKFFLYNFCESSYNRNFDLEKYLTSIEEENNKALEKVRAIVPECEFALISSYSLGFLVTDSKGNPMFITNKLGIIKNDEKEMRLFGCAKKTSKERECGIILSLNKESKTFQARILSSVYPNEYSVGKDKSVPMTVSFDTSAMEYGYGDYAIIDMDERYMYLEKLDGSYYNNSSWEKLTRNKDNAYKYDMVTGDLVRTRKIPIEDDDLYESKKEGKR